MELVIVVSPSKVELSWVSMYVRYECWSQIHVSEDCDFGWDHEGKYVA